MAFTRHNVSQIMAFKRLNASQIITFTCHGVSHAISFARHGASQIICIEYANHKELSRNLYCVINIMNELVTSQKISSV